MHKKAFDIKSREEIADWIAAVRKVVYEEAGVPEHILFVTSEEKSPDGINSSHTE